MDLPTAKKIILSLCRTARLPDPARYIHNRVNLFRKSRSRVADEVFSKFDLDIKHQHRLPAGMQLNLAVEGFTSLSKLPPQEQFFLGGLDSVRGYPSGDFLADHAFQANAEWLFPAFFIPEDMKLSYAEGSLKESLAPLLFVDYGYGEKRGTPAGEEDSVHFASVGGGFRFRLYNQLVLRVEAGIPVAHNPITEHKDYIVHFSMEFEDRLPEEIERIKNLKALAKTPEPGVVKN